MSMIFKVQITSNGTYTLPLTYPISTPVTINWGGGTPIEETVNVSNTMPTHNYTVNSLPASYYTITITSSGTNGTFGTSGGTSLSSKIVSVTQWGSIGITDLSYACYKATGLVSVPSIPTTITDTHNMFDGCTSLNFIVNWMMNNVTDMSYMFKDCTSLNSSISLSTSSLNNVFGIFYRCSILNSLVSFTTSSTIKNMAYMFYGCTQFNQPLTLDTSNVTNMRDMFRRCNDFNQSLSFDTSKVTNMQNMFYECVNIDQTLSFTTTKVTLMNGMFYGCTAFNNGSTMLVFNTSNVLDMGHMFYKCENFNQPITFTTTKVQDMTHMFYGCTIFNQSLSFYTNTVTNMAFMFENCKAYNQITHFVTPNVTTMEGMFNGCSSLNSAVTLTSSSVTNMNAMFDGCTLLSASISLDTSNVQNMTYMFHKCLAFNQDLGWNLSKIPSGTSSSPKTAMYNMFKDTGLTQTVYTSILDGFTGQSIIPTYMDLGIVSDGTNLTQRSNATSYNALTGTYNWSIEDGGLYIDPPIPEDNRLKFTINLITGITLNIVLTGTFTIDWGDSSSYSGTTGTISHTYTSGTYQVRLNGAITAFNGGTITNYATSVDTWGDLGITDFSYSFSNASLTDVSGDFPEDVLNVSHLFFHSTIPDIDWNTTGTVEDMSYMFRGATVQSVTLDTSNVRDMKGMFQGSTIVTVSLSSTTEVTDMSFMFYFSLQFNQYLDFDTSNVTTMESMFKNAVQFRQSLGGWNISQVITMDGIFTHSGMDEMVYDETLNGWATQEVQPDVVVGNVTNASGRFLYHNNSIGAYEFLIENGWVINDAGAQDIQCFLKGTIIITPSGYVPVESLKVGHMVITHDQRIVKIMGIEKTTPPEQENTYPYKIPQGTRLQNYICIQDLYLSPEHAVLVQYPYVVPIKYGPYQQEKDVDLEYYHIVLPNFYTDMLIANGLPCESLCVTPDPQLTPRVMHNRYRHLLSVKEYNSIVHPAQFLF